MKLGVTPVGLLSEGIANVMAPPQDCDFLHAQFTRKINEIENT